MLTKLVLFGAVREQHNAFKTTLNINFFIFLSRSSL
jgi:hypothetical protein